MRRTKASLASWWTTSSRKSTGRLGWSDIFHFKNPVLLLPAYRCGNLWLSDLLYVQDEGCECWLQHQKLQKDSPLPLQQEDAVHFSVYWTLPVSHGCISEDSFSVLHAAFIFLHIKRVRHRDEMVRAAVFCSQVVLPRSLSSSDSVPELRAQSASVLLHLPGRHRARPRLRPPQMSVLSWQLVPP